MSLSRSRGELRVGCSGAVQSFAESPNRPTSLFPAIPDGKLPRSFPGTALVHPLFLAVRCTAIEKTEIPHHGTRRFLDIETIPAAAE
ncbi:conserved hypothetical protein [Ricinus communis]|uniref:Uncharacterized protein n=1 Tax=Ricinus communis TaxID=3988 RepID=B9TLK2_RICCO|nr:conserved hypothetical protein [Ricinus communis]